MINLLSITPKAARLLETDPHGLTLTLIAVSVVFLGLLILYYIYTFSGNLFSGKYKNKSVKRKKNTKGKTGAVNGELAAAIALALECEAKNEEEVAIALALHLYMTGNAHDAESFILTMNRNDSAWDDKKLNFRKLPR